MTILHPHKAGREKLTARFVGAEEHVIEVQMGKETDYIMLFPVSKEYRDDKRGVAMIGRVAVVRIKPSSAVLTLVDGTRLCYNGREIGN